MVQKLILELCHVDVGGALGLAAFAFQTEIQDVVEALAGELGGGERAGEDGAKGVGATTGGVLLLTGDHVGGAHGIAILAAGPDTVAELDRAGESTVAGEVEESVHLHGLIIGAEAEVLRHRRDSR